jgi:hypothetical protein
VQVFKHQEQPLHLTFAQQYTLQRRQGALAALGWIEMAERAVVGQSVQKSEQRRDHVLEGRVQR